MESNQYRDKDEGEYESNDENDISPDSKIDFPDTEPKMAVPHLPHKLSTNSSKNFSSGLNIAKLDDKYTMSVFSWNCGGSMPKKDNISMFFDATFSQGSSDIVVFGFQETIRLSLYNCWIRGHNEDDVDELALELQSALNHYHMESENCKLTIHTFPKTLNKIFI